MRRMTSLLLACILAGPLAAQGFELEGYHPERDLFLVEGNKVTILCTDAQGARLRATYRPGSAVTHVEEVGEVADQVVWAPEAPGLVQLDLYRTETLEGGATKDVVLASKVVSVRFDTSLPSGLFVMILAGAFLFGGAFQSIRALLRG